MTPVKLRLVACNANLASMVTANDVREFYDEFSAGLLRDYLIPNRRVLAQFEFLRDALPPTVRTVLIIGCGNGHVAHYLATRVARQARVLGLDISPQNISIAETLFSHPRVEFRCLDVVNEPPSGTWDAIVLPDVYEHIPLADRSRLHAALHRLLSDHSRLLLTLPSLLHQAMLRERGSALQIVDEDVSLADLARLGDEANAAMIYYAQVSIWGAHDYVHVALERGRSRELAIEPADQLRIHRCVSPLRAKLALCFGRFGLWGWPWRYLRVRRAQGRMRRRAQEIAASARVYTAETRA